MCFLSVDWSGPWLEQLDLQALTATDRHSSAQAQAALSTNEAVNGPTSARASPPAAHASSRRRSLSLDQPSITLEQCLRDYTKEETLDPSEAYYCSACKDHKCAKRKVTLLSAQLPEVLIVMLKVRLISPHPPTPPTPPAVI